MALHLELANSRAIVIPNHDIHATQNGNQLHFRYQGLSNDKFGDRVLLCQSEFNFERSATVLGDGFQMLAQTSGTIEQPIDIGRCPDNSTSYRIYSRQEPTRYYNYLMVEDSLGPRTLKTCFCFRRQKYGMALAQARCSYVNMIWDLGFAPTKLLPEVIIACSSASFLDVLI